jgi:hypothetical protein
MPADEAQGSVHPIILETIFDLERSLLTLHKHAATARVLGDIKRVSRLNERIAVAEHQLALLKARAKRRIAD